MKVTGYANWDKHTRDAFAGAGPGSKMYLSDDGEAMVIATPAEEFDNQLISCEFHIPNPDHDGIETDPMLVVNFLCPDWDAVEFLAAELFHE